MPINVPDQLPAIELLQKENIFIMDESRATQQDIRPLKIVILNLMPIKITTETDLIRLLSNSPLQVEVEFLRMKGHESKNTPEEHMKAFYKTFDEIKLKNYDGMIITGAPVEMLPFEEVTYWSELVEIFEWSKIHATSTLFICWAAQAGLFHFYNIPKYILDKKMFGVFKHRNLEALPIFRGFDDEYFVPHSRHTEVREEDILKVNELSIISKSEESGVNMVMTHNGRQFFITGHSEYSRNTLDTEYKRDLKKKLPIEMPRNYYPNNDASKKPMMLWHGHANLLFSNWLNYYVYQQTPYNLDNLYFEI
ncbi:MAG TPA: homoserine O-succinyltransferase [Prolixibacteraceae bacterium]|nr:homoserine O-succinyltransferase [Prolixibacteraceae bacterium]HPR84423.1 homoserine O-succinyltransferase [Prolixibacteraceae bacterium]